MSRLYQPWVSGDAAFSRVHDEARAYGPMLVSPDRCYILHAFALRPIAGDVVECGVYDGGTAHILAATLDGALPLHLFDTFTGMPDTAIPSRDYHRPGDFGDTSLPDVRARLAAYPEVVFHPGFIPRTFSGLPELVSLAHIDLDIYPSIWDACCGIWPRLAPGGGVMIFDDYGFTHLTGARAAVDDFFADKRDKPITLPTGQAIVIKS